jgi:hypothetical protein
VLSLFPSREYSDPGARGHGSATQPLACRGSLSGSCRKGLEIADRFAFGVAAREAAEQYLFYRRALFGMGKVNGMGSFLGELAGFAESQSP